MNRVVALWGLLVEPPPRISDPEQRRKLRLLLTSLAILIPGGLLIGSLSLFGEPGYRPGFIVIAGGMLLLAPAYGLARGGWFRSAAVLAVAITQLTCFVIAIANPGDPWPYAFLIVGTFLARLFFEGTGIVVSTVTALTGVAVLSGLGTAPPGVSPLAAPLFLVIGAALLLIAQRHRAALEHDRSRELRESEANLRALAENTNDGILVNVDGRHVFANRRLAELLGYNAAEELLGTTIDDLVHPDKREEIHARFRARLDGAAVPPQYETLFRTRGGEPLPVELNAATTRWRGRLAGLVSIRDIRERKQAEMRTMEDARELGRILDNLQDTYYRTDAEGRVVLASASVRKLLGYEPREVAGRRLAEMYVEPDGRARFLAALTAAGGDIRNYETELRRKDGSAVWVSTHSRFLRDAEGRLTGVEGVVRDVTEQKAARERMRKLSSALEQTADIVMITDRTGTIEYVNPEFERRTGYTSAEAIGNTGRLLKSGRQGPAFYETLWQTILSGRPFTEVFINRRKDGTRYFEEKTISPLKDEQGQITHFISTGKDVSERVQVQEQLQHMAQHDALTGLPNRLLLLDRLRQALARARWRRRLVALLFVDIDRFKTINDSLGHEIGDQLLQRIAGRLGHSVRDGDTVARFGGDEFVILLDDVADEDDVRGVAHKVLEAIVPPFEVEGRQLYMTASIGVSLYPNDGEDSSSLLKNADIAMYRAKDSGKNTYRFFSADMSIRAFERLAMESSLRRALERGEFELHYQPQLDAVTGRLVGVEALLRWQHPDLGLVPPADFIAVLEDTGLILPTGAWVLQHACAQLAAWRVAGWPHLRVAVNLSPRQFEDKALLATLRATLAPYGPTAGLLEIEITEGVLAQHTEAVRETLAAMRALGVRIAIDDFGTGYSSLSYLRRFPVDTLKIDRSFIQDIPQDPDDCAIATAVTALAASLKLEMVAEGVETEAQRDFLLERGCRQMQGFLFSRALPAAELSQWMEKRRLPGAPGAGEAVVEGERRGE